MRLRRGSWFLETSVWHIPHSGAARISTRYRGVRVQERSGQAASGCSFFLKIANVEKAAKCLEGLGPRSDSIPIALSCQTGQASSNARASKPPRPQRAVRLRPHPCCRAELPIRF